MAEIVRKQTNHLDADETAFFKRQLEYVKARTYDVKYKDLKAFNLIPVSAEAPMGATEITWRSFKQYGLARIIADYAHDFPRVDVFGEENTVKIKDIGDSYGYSINEIRRAAMAGFDLEGRRSITARRAIDEKINSIALYGDTDHNIQGLIDYPGITEYTAALNAAGTSREWANKTADEILADLNGIVTAIITTTTGKERPDTILLPIAQYQLIKNTRVGTASDTTIFEFFRRNNPDITVEWLSELDGAGELDTDNASTDRMLAYTRDDMHLTLEIPIAFEQLEEEKTGMEYRIPCHAATAGVIIYYPLSVAFADGI
jgi:hypothetical protein